MGQDDSNSRGKPARPASAPTVPMRPVRTKDLHSAPTVPMEPVRLPIKPTPEPKPAAPKPAKSTGQVERSPTPADRPAARPAAAPPPPAAPSPAAPPPVARTSFPAAAAGTRARPPVPEDPKEPKPPAQRGSGSTSMMLKSSKLNQLLDQTLRSGGSKSEAPLLYDGLTPAKGVTIIDPGQIILSPMQSFPGKRTVTTTQDVINQYAVVANPRYLVRNVDPREAGALFVFDVMNSQNTTLGRAFLAGSSGAFRPGTLAETWKWLIEMAPSLGWRVVHGKALWDALGKGLPVIAMGETPYGPRLAVVEPGFPGPTARPRLASAHEPRGQGQSPEDIFGSSVVRYLVHD